jgi:hypothetical protein
MGSKERGILFSGEMVRAILDGRKTQTRRVVKPQPPKECSIHYPLGNESWVPEADRTPFRHTWEAWGGPLYHARPDKALCGSHDVRCPYGKPGDCLWVRESHWRFTGCASYGKPWDGFVESPNGDPYDARCYDDYPNISGATEAAAVVRVPSIHMPRWASRITLEITDMRVERIREISVADALAEGCCVSSNPNESDAFHNLWNRINAKRGYSYESNPWVWAITFKRVDNAL